jgi:hypothetical protein
MWRHIHIKWMQVGAKYRQEFCPPGYNTILSIESQPTFQRNMSPPSSGSKNKLSKKFCFHSGFLITSFDLKMEVIFLWSAVHFRWTTQRYIVEDIIFFIYIIYWKTCKQHRHVNFVNTNKESHNINNCTLMLILEIPKKNTYFHLGITWALSSLAKYIYIHSKSCHHEKLGHLCSD